MHEYERGYSPEEQKEIIQIAARLQREHSDHLTGIEPIDIAAEAGIEPGSPPADLESVRRSDTSPNCSDAEQTSPNRFA